MFPVSLGTPASAVASLPASCQTSPRNKDPRSLCLSSRGIQAIHPASPRLSGNDKKKSMPWAHQSTHRRASGSSSRIAPGSPPAPTRTRPTAVSNAQRRTAWPPVNTFHLLLLPLPFRPLIPNSPLPSPNIPHAWAYSSLCQRFSDKIE